MRPCVLQLPAATRETEDEGARAGVQVPVRDDTAGTADVLADRRTLTHAQAQAVSAHCCPRETLSVTRL